jgi:hypothetical protein
METSLDARKRKKLDSKTSPMTETKTENGVTESNKQANLF